MAFGIDLGTTHSCVARIDSAGRPEIIKSAIGEDTTPSVVYFESVGSAVVGRAAKNMALMTPDLVAQLVKRDMGTDVSYTFHGQRNTPETVSALILRELAQTAREHTGEEVKDVVITVPAYFGVAEREATRRAGVLAGLKVLDVLAEPVAAAMHYQAVTSAPDGQPADPARSTRHILVYDLGGGTFDTTVIRLEDDDITVVCTDGERALGGADWDQAIAGYLLDRFTEQHPRLAPRDDPQFMQDQIISAEQLKKELGKIKSRRHIMRFGGAVAQVELSRETMEELTADLLDRTVAVTERTIETAREKGVPRFDDVLLVGGMTRLPAVTRVLKERLGLDARHHEPDLAVAKGAALFALMRTIRQDGEQAAVEDVAAQTGLSVDEVEKMARKRVATVVPRGFGVRGIDARDPLAISDPVRAREIVVHLLPANTPLPADTGPYPFATAVENQRMVGIEVWEQAGPIESEDPADNRKVGEGMLRDLPPRLPARTSFEVTFLMSETGLLTVHAIEPRSGKDVRFELQIGGLDKAGMDKARRSVANYQVSG
jgi:molecular chaperone DnaK